MAIDLEKNHGVFIHEGVFNELQDKVEDIDQRVTHNTAELQEHSEKIAENIENINANKNELIKHEGEIAENKQAIEETKQHLDEVQADLEQKIASEHAFTEQEIAGVRTELTNAKNELNERIDREVNDLNATIDSTKQALQGSIDALAATEQQDKAELEEKINANQDSIDDLGTRVKALEDFKTEINEKVDTNITDINQLKTQVSTLAGDAQRLSTQLDTTNQQLSTLSSLVDQTRDDLESAKTELDDKIAAIVDHDTYVVSGTVNDRTLTLTQNDESKNVLITLPDYKTTDTYLSTVVSTDDKLQFVQTDPSKNFEVDLPHVDLTPIEKSLFEIQAIHQYENTVFTATANEGVHQPTDYYISKHGGFALMRKLVLGGTTPAYNLYGLFRTSTPATTSINQYVLNFLDLNDFSVYYADIPTDQHGNGQDTSQYVEYFASHTTQGFNTPNIPNNRINWTLINAGDKTLVIALAKTNTILYSQGAYTNMLTTFNSEIGFNQNSAGPLAFNLEAAANNAKLAQNIRTEVSSQNSHTQGLIDLMEPFTNTDGDVEIPLTFIPRYNVNNISEVEVPAQIETQIGEIPTGYELRMYELELIG